MEETTSGQPNAVRVTLGASEYTVAAGTGVEIALLIANPGPSSDTFKISLLGIPSGWVTLSGPPEVWVPSGGQEKVALTVCPPAEEEVAGTYRIRLQVTGQTDPGKRVEQEVQLLVVRGETAKRISLSVETHEIPAVPGTDVKIPLLLGNHAGEADYLELSVQGVPASWVSIPSPVIYLSGGEEKSVDIILSLPSQPEVRAGYYPVKITAASQKDPAVRMEAEVMLGIAAFESSGRVGVMLKSVQFTAAPGGSLTIPLTVLNRGLEADAFLLGIEGIPLSWVSTSTPVISLRPGENKEAALVIRPPLSPQSQAGRYKINIKVWSQSTTDQIVKVDCTLTVTAYTQFKASLEPWEVEAGQPVRVTVQNEGNIQQVFHYSCESQNDQLIFEYLQPEGTKQPAKAASVETPGQPDGKAAAGSQPAASPSPPPQDPQAAAGDQVEDPTLLAIPPGEAAAFRFTARPRQRPLIGGAVTYPYLALVEAKGMEAQTLSGRVSGRGMIPVWLLPIIIALFLCSCLVFTSGLLVIWGGAPTTSPTQTAAAGTALAAGATQTALADTAVSAGATQTITANQTAAAAAGQQDDDGDGLTNQREMEIQTDPANTDTDGDGLMDGEEVFQSGTNPLNPDSDGDGLKDGEELQQRTNPLAPDSDGDQSRDGDEVRLGTDPLNQDSDGDGLVDSSETQACPAALNPDSDQDGIVDGKDLSPCDANNPALTATAAALLPTPTTAPPTTAPPTAAPPTTAPPTAAPPTAASTQPPSPLQTAAPLPRFQGSILFESDRDGNREIYAVDDSGKVNRLTNSPSLDIQPAWGPGNQRIAFTTNRDGQNEIYLMNADGSNPINLTNNPADDQHPAWSPDGQWIAFTSNREGNYEIYILRVDGSELRNLTQNPGNDAQPDWVRSTTIDTGGEHIVFTTDRDGNLEIYRMKADGTEAVNLTGNPAGDHLPEGSTDGALVLFTSDRDGNNEIYSMEIDGNGQANLTNNPSNDYGPAWSPDQGWVAFTTDRSGDLEVNLITQPGMPELYNLTNSPGYDQGADWR